MPNKDEVNGIAQSLFGRHAGRKFIALMAFFVVIVANGALKLAIDIETLAKSLGWFFLAQGSVDLSGGVMDSFKKRVVKGD